MAIPCITRLRQRPSLQIPLVVGDAFLATVLLGLLTGQELAVMARLAAERAGEVCGRPRCTGKDHFPLMAPSTTGTNLGPGGREF